MGEIEAYLNKIRESIEPTDRQIQNIQDRLDRLRETIDAFDCAISVEGLSRKSYIHGSWKRHTIIRKSQDLSWDVDLIVIMGFFVRHWSPRSLHTDIEKPLSKLSTLKRNLGAYSDRIIPTQDYPCVILNYQSDNFNLEIMPVLITDNEYYFDSTEAFQRQNCGYTPQDKFRIFLIPNPIQRNEWMYTRPFVFEKELSETNSQYDGMVVPSIKILKHWNNTHGRNLRSYEIERYINFFFDTQANIVGLSHSPYFEDIIRKWFLFT